MNENEKNTEGMENTDLRRKRRKKSNIKKPLVIVLCILVVLNITMVFANLYKLNKKNASEQDIVIKQEELDNAKEDLDDTEDELEYANEVFKSEMNKKNNAQKHGESKLTNTEPATPPPAPSADAETPAHEKVTENITVCIDAGHGITSKSGKEPVSPGSSEKKASNVSGAAGEEPLNLEISLKLQKALEARGIKTDMVRTTNNCDKTNVERAEQANASSDYCIRIHCDGSENKSVHGISVLIPAKSYYGDSSFVPKSTALGQIVLDSLITATGAKNVGLITRSDLTGFNWSKIPVILVECGFVSNADEKAKLQTAEYQDKLANAIADGFVKYVKGSN